MPNFTQQICLASFWFATVALIFIQLIQITDGDECDFKYTNKLENKNGLDLTDGAQDPEFKKEFIFVANLELIRSLVSGSNTENYEFHYYLGDIPCNQSCDCCDDEMCVLPGMTGVCDTNTNLCTCTGNCNYPQHCQMPPILAVQLTNSYIGTHDTEQTKSYIVNSLFITKCSGESIPNDPEPIIQILPSEEINGVVYFQIYLSFTKYIGLTGTSTYYWIRFDTLVKQNTYSIALILQEKFTIAQLAQMLDQDMVRKVAEFQQKQEPDRASARFSN